MRVPSSRIPALKRPFKKYLNLLRDPYPRNKELVFEDYELNFPEIKFTYSVDSTRYESTAKIDLPVEILAKLNRDEHHPLFVNLGLSLAAGHFLLTDFATVCCACAKLEPRDIELLESQLQESLTEFRYLQGLDPSRPVRVRSSGITPLRPIPFPNVEEKALMLNGGGKDSCVSAELLKSIGLPFAWLNALPLSTRNNVVAQSGVAEAYSVNFAVSSQVTLDAAYAWGPKPYIYTILSASLIVGYLKGFKYLVTGAEHSADDPNLVYKGVAINHQTGKTSTFEQFFNEFTQRSILQDTKAFSIARPFTDLRLAEMFSHFPKYFDVFLSCNVGMGSDKWCNSCYKCAFTYLAFYPFFEQEELVNIFGANLFDIPVIRKSIIELASASIKPWNCVGTQEESKLALYYCLQKSPDMEFKEWPKRSDLEKACVNIDKRMAYKNTMSTFHTPHNIPTYLEKPLREIAASLLEKSAQRLPKLG